MEKKTKSVKQIRKKKKLQKISTQGRAGSTTGKTRDTHVAEKKKTSQTQKPKSVQKGKPSDLPKNQKEFLNAVGNVLAVTSGDFKSNTWKCGCGVTNSKKDRKCGNCGWISTDL